MPHDYTTFAAPAPHPGEHIREDYLPAYNLTPGRLARAMGLGNARQRIERLVRGQQDITADTALRLGRVFGTTPDFWLNLQATHDLSKAALANREAIAAIQMLEVA